MLNFTWKVFSETGSIETYLLFKEIEQGDHEHSLNAEEELAEADFPIT